MKFGYIWPSGLEEKSFESVDGRTTEASHTISSPRSLRLRGAKKTTLSHDFFFFSNFSS